jgi:hypothetical protein
LKVRRSVEVRMRILSVGFSMMSDHPNEGV